MRIFKNKWFARFVIKNDVSDGKLLNAVEEAENGNIDADLGGGLIKKRIARGGEGKRGGFRTIIAYRRGDWAFFVYGFPKNVADNIDEKDLAALKRLAGIYGNLSDVEITEAVDHGILTEVCKDVQKVQK